MRLRIMSLKPNDSCSSIHLQVLKCCNFEHKCQLATKTHQIQSKDSWFLKISGGGMGGGGACPRPRLLEGHNLHCFTHIYLPSQKMCPNLVPRPPPRLYLAAVEKSRGKPAPWRKAGASRHRFFSTAAR